MRTRGFTQNEEYIGLALRQGREFIIPCLNDKDADSKRVSLYNVKRSLSLDDQRMLSIQKIDWQGGKAIRIRKSAPEVWELVDGKYVKIEETSADVSSMNQDLIKEMLSAGLDEKDIIDAITSRGELEDKVRSFLTSLKEEGVDNERAEV